MTREDLKNSGFETYNELLGFYFDKNYKEFKTLFGKLFKEFIELKNDLCTNQYLEHHFGIKPDTKSRIMNGKVSNLEIKRLREEFVPTLISYRDNVVEDPISKTVLKAFVDSEYHKLLLLLDSGDQNKIDPILTNRFKKCLMRHQRTSAPLLTLMLGLSGRIDISFIHNYTIKYEVEGFLTELQEEKIVYFDKNEEAYILGIDNFNLRNLKFRGFEESLMEEVFNKFAKMNNFETEAKKVEGSYFQVSEEDYRKMAYEKIEDFEDMRKRASEKEEIFKKMKLSNPDVKGVTMALGFFLVPIGDRVSPRKSDGATDGALHESLEKSETDTLRAS